MAAGRPWYKRNGGDFVMAVMSMPDSDTKWAYSAIIDMLNDRDRPIPDEPAFLCGFTGLSKKKWHIVRKYLVDNGYLVPTEDGRITNPRFERERAEREAEHQNSVETGRMGGKKSAALRAAGQTEMDLETPSSDEHLPNIPPIIDPINGRRTPDKLEMLEQKPQISATEIEPPPQPTRARQRREEREEEESTPPAPTPVTARAPDALDIADDLCRLGGVRNLEPGRIIEHQTLVRQWLDLGADKPLMERIVSEQRDRFKGDRGISSLRYFDAAIRRAYAIEADRRAKAHVVDPKYRAQLDRKAREWTEKDQRERAEVAAANKDDRINPSEVEATNRMMERLGVSLRYAKDGRAIPAPTPAPRARGRPRS